MRNSISQEYLEILLNEANRTARRLVRRLRLPRECSDDIRQDLLTDLLGRIHRFDPERGTLGAFAAAILANRATQLANQVKRERRLIVEAPVSMNDAIPGGDGLTFGDQIGEDRSLSALFGQPNDAFLAAEQRIDLERALRTLNPDEAALCTALSQTTVDRLAASGRGPRSSLYRRIREIRLTLAALGVKSGETISNERE